jgi:phospholipase C
MRTRRDFLRFAAAAAAGTGILPPAIQRALAIPAARRTGTIKDVEHVVILMQENRSFDHYFGTLRGVRGFSDPRPAPLPNGKSIWHQPIAETKTNKYHDRGLSPEATQVLPFYINPQLTTEFVAGTDHGWSSGHLAWNHGHWNQWLNQKQDVLTMGYLKRLDVSFHYSLADAFTICDAYHCSVHANTAPNRIYMWSGTMDPRNAYGIRPTGPGFGERPNTNGYTWTTYPERLEKAGVSWKVYQGGSGEPGTPTDNYTDNSLEFFAQYHVQEGTSPTGPLVQKGVTDRTLLGFKEDVATGKLAQVNWVVAPYKYSEHPEASPTDGAYYISLVLDALTANPEVWAKTVLLINYDENDGLFDHIVPPMPPKSQARNRDGLVSDDLLESLGDEFIDMTNYPHERRPVIHDADPGGVQPIGLGPRVPMLVISPWSTGGWVNSELCDHTSVLRFLEKRFDIAEPNISAWRRSICGDLTSAFDFSQKPSIRNTSFPAPKPIQSQHQPYSVPEPQIMPVQEPGTRPARALPYAIETSCRVKEDSVELELINKGKAGAAFYIYNGAQPADAPRRYTVSVGNRLVDHWNAIAGQSFDLAVYGPNGYLVQQKGSGGSSEPSVTLELDAAKHSLRLTLLNSAPLAVTVALSESYTKHSSSKTIAAGAQTVVTISLPAKSRWYDITATISGNAAYQRRFAGHLEDGTPGTSDPQQLA